MSDVPPVSFIIWDSSCPAISGSSNWMPYVFKTLLLRIVFKRHILMPCVFLFAIQFSYTSQLQRSH